MRALFYNRVKNDQRAFTLIELVFAIVIIALISALAVTRFEPLQQWKQKGELRKFVDTWEFLYNEALARGQAYRLEIDLDTESYYVRREIQLQQSESKQVDYLQNLRTKSEQDRRAKREEEELSSIKEEYKEEDERLTQTVEKLYYDYLLADPEGSIRLGRPLEFPSLAETKSLPPGLEFRDVKTRKGKKTDGRVSIRFSPKGAAEFAVVHLIAGERVFTAFMNPSSGEVSIRDGDQDFDWLRGKTSES